MSNRDDPGRQPARQTSDRDAGKRPDGGEVPASATPAGDRTTPLNEAAEKELLCTICGMRACWQ